MVYDMLTLWVRRADLSTLSDISSRYGLKSRTLDTLATMKLVLLGAPDKTC
jgi:hypothetical protein